jgi:phosphoribosylglycinamide formyltransferase-1
MARLKLGILISGRGSNMLALAEACRQPDFPAEVAVVVANRLDAAGLAVAAALGITTETVDQKAHAGKPAFEAALDTALRRHDVDLVCLAGFMRILSAEFIAGWDGRILNIHPSLLPDYKGLDTHARALADGRDKGGCTVHYVIPEMDAGPVILQKTVPILPGDTADSLAARVLEQEHAAYPEAVRLVAGTLLLSGDDKRRENA